MEEHYAAKISKASHDLRNALGIIYSYAEVLELTLQGGETKDAHDSAEALLRAVRDMEAMLTKEFEGLKEGL
jgi:signal transduction histidine kinase